MNSLSWLLYAAEISGGMRGMFTVIAWGSAAAIPFVFVAAQWLHDFSDLDDDGVKRIRGKWRGAFTSLLVFGTLTAITPSRETILLIAASEVGESVLASEQAQEIGGEAGALATDSLRVLRKFINEQLGEGAE